MRPLPPATRRSRRVDDALAVASVRIDERAPDTTLESRTVAVRRRLTPQRRLPREVPQPSRQRRQAGVGAMQEETCVRARCGPLWFPVRDRSEKNCRGELVESLLLLRESQALTNRRLDPLNEVVSRFDRPCPIDQSSDHFRLRDVPAPRPSRQAGGALFIELHGDRWHGNTQILPCGAIGSRRFAVWPFAVRGSRFAVRGSRFAVRHQGFRFLPWTRYARRRSRTSGSSRTAVRITARSRLAENRTANVQ